MRRFELTPCGPLRGVVDVPGDKSISHRSLMLGAIADGTTQVDGFLAGADCLATLSALRAMGVSISQPQATRVIIEGVGLRGLQPPPGNLDMGNSGTAMRLFAGLLAGQAFDSVLIGDASLSGRPMERVAEPLRSMGAEIATLQGHPPLNISGGKKLRGIHYAMPVASAQVKSALLLAGLYAEGETVVTEPAVTRDHSERMLACFGVDVTRSGDRVTLQPPLSLKAGPISVPGDLSSAAFFLLGACTIPGSELIMEQVGLNPTRTGVLKILELMGADFEIETLSASVDREPMARLTVRYAALQGIEVPPELVPLAIDEFPVLFVAAALAKGTTTITGAAELRHKESDRIGVMADGLRALGAAVEEYPDGARIHGGPLSGGCVNSHGDHRVAMAFAMAAATADGPVEILDTANVNTSFPGFAEIAAGVGLDIRAVNSG